MCCREDSKKIIPFQKNRIQIGTDGQAEKAAVYPPFPNPCFNFAIIPQKNFIIDIGIILLKFPDVSAVVLSAVLLREGMSLLRLLGVGCILGGAMLAEMSGKKTRSSFSE